MELLVLAILLGLIPAIIAAKKGRSFVLWWVYGALLFIVALVHSLLISDGGAGAWGSSTYYRMMRKCPWCAEDIKLEAKVCKHCQRDVLTPREPALSGDIPQS